MRNMAVLSRSRLWVKRLLECVSLPASGLSSTCEQSRALWANLWNTRVSIMWLDQLHGLRELSLISMLCVWLDTFQTSVHKDSAKGLQHLNLKARLHRRFLSQQLDATFVALKLHQVSNMRETPAISRRQIALKIALGTRAILKLQLKRDRNCIELPRQKSPV